MPTPAFPTAGTRTFTDGQVPTATDWGKAFGSDAWWLSGRPRFQIDVSGDATANQAIAANTFTTIAGALYNSARSTFIDPDSAFSASAGTYTCPTAGFYIFTFAVTWVDNSVGNRWIFGDPDPSGDGNTVRAAAAGTSSTGGDPNGQLSVCWMKRCTQGQVITPQVYTDSAASVGGVFFSAILVAL